MQFEISVVDITGVNSILLSYKMFSLHICLQTGACCIRAHSYSDTGARHLTVYLECPSTVQSDVKVACLFIHTACCVGMPVLFSTSTHVCASSFEGQLFKTFTSLSFMVSTGWRL